MFRFINLKPSYIAGLMPKNLSQSFHKESSFHLPKTADPFKHLNLSHDKIMMNSRPVRSKQKPVRPRKTTDDFKLVYKSPKYLNKHKAKAKDIDGSFMPKTHHNLDHVS